MYQQDNHGSAGEKEGLEKTGTSDHYLKGHACLEELTEAEDKI